MKIVNICLAGSYNNGWGYQDNLISKYQVKNGNDVTIITSRFINDKNSEDYLEVESGISYDNGVKIVRLEHGFGRKITKIFRHYKNIYNKLEEEKPDVIFIHCLQFIDILYVCKYLKINGEVRCCVDGHADYSNSARTIFAKILHKTLWKYCAKKINVYASVFYGVLPLRCDFMNEMYGIDKKKIKLLVMGADDELANMGIINRNKTRSSMGLNVNDFLIITGGKIDSFKMDTIELMKTINANSNKNIKLLIFGSVSNEVKEAFEKNMSSKIKYVGWLNQVDIYNYMAASDFGFFPGRHSVIWEQMVALGKPCAFKKIDRTDHINIGGNCIFLSDNTPIEFEKVLNYILDVNNYNKMLKNANKEEKNKFLYSKISKYSLDFLNTKH